jgi:hypothetical protein
MDQFSLRYIEVARVGLKRLHDGKYKEGDSNPSRKKQKHM